MLQNKEFSIFFQEIYEKWAELSGEQQNISES